MLHRWWADPIAGFVIVSYGAREASTYSAEPVNYFPFGLLPE